MRRRDLLGGLAALAAGRHVDAAEAKPHEAFDRYFLEVLGGFLRNARRTSPSWAVCEYPQGTVLKNFLARSGKTCDSVARMMPAMAAWTAGARQPSRFDVEGDTVGLDEVLRSAFIHAFDAAHPDYWLASPADQPDQRQVESSIVAWSLWLLRDKLLPTLSPAQRANIQAWLASCTRVSARRSNWAWFTAVNHAARLSLSERYPEFSGDEAWMLDDLKFLDSLAAPGDGWYSDSPKEPQYDYYNFWVFASHFLYWNRMVGAGYPDWSKRFGDRLKQFLETAPYFFSGEGGHVLFGRSLIYRWAVLTPLVLAYKQGFWPHSPGMLRRIARASIEYHWRIGAFDAKLGKLRETYSAGGNREICDSYINHGHPYWGMQAFALFLIPPGDPFWTAPEEALPIEHGDFRIRMEGTRMLLDGTERTGHVRWLLALSGRGGADYRDKYAKFCYSSHFPLNILKLDKRCAWDAALIFRDPKTGDCAARSGVKIGRLLADGVETEWWAELGDMRFDVTSRIRLEDEFEDRTHIVTAPRAALDAGIEVIEGSLPLGLEEGEICEQEPRRDWRWMRAARSGRFIATWKVSSYDRLEPAESFEETGRRGVNTIYPRMAVNTLRATLRQEKTILASLHYASPKPLPLRSILSRAERMMKARQAYAVSPQPSAIQPRISKET